MPEPQYLLILRRPGAARLLLPTLVARIPDSIAATAIAVLVRSATGSYFSAGFAAGAFGAGTAVSAPVAGRALDRLGQRRLLPLLAIGFAAALTALALASGHSGPGVLDAVAAAAGLTRPPVEAALRAMWPKLVPPNRVAAYALDSTVQELIWIGGPLLLALLLATGSRQFPLLACAAASAVGTAVYAAGLRSAPASREAPAGAVSPLRGGRFRVLLVPRLLRCRGRDPQPVLRGIRRCARRRGVGGRPGGDLGSRQPAGRPGLRQPGLTQPGRGTGGRLPGPVRRHADATGGRP